MLQHLRAVSLYRSNFSDKQIFGTPIYSDVSCASVGDSVALDSCVQALDHLSQNDNIYSFKFQLETKNKQQANYTSDAKLCFRPCYLGDSCVTV